MEKVNLNYQNNGFNATYYPYEGITKKVLILLSLDKEQEIITNACIKYFKESKVNLLVLHNLDKTNGICNFPLEIFEKACNWLSDQNNRKIGIIGFSRYSMLALTASSYLPSISLVIVYSPCDYITQGYYKGKKGKMKEWIADTSSISYHNLPLTYLSCDNEELYWQSVSEHRSIYADLDEKSLENDYYIPVENIKGNVIMFSAKDDPYHPSSRYCKRMNNRLNHYVFPYHVENHIYETGGHDLYPEGMIDKMSLISLKLKGINTKDEEYKKTRYDIDQYTKRAIQRW